MDSIKEYIPSKAVGYIEELLSSYDIQLKIKSHENNKLDISLGHIGYRNIEPNSNFILDKITDSDGFLAVTDKSSPELIKDTFQMSKKSFKKALGSLYKQQLITIKNDGIYLNDK